MSKEKKLSRNDPKVFETLINKELEKYGVSYDYIKNNQEFDGVPWYQYYIFNSQEEYEKWKSFCKEFLQKKVTPKMTNKEFNNWWPSFDLCYGLKQNF